MTESFYTLIIDMQGNKSYCSFHATGVLLERIFRRVFRKDSGCTVSFASSLVV